MLIDAIDDGYPARLAFTCCHRRYVNAASLANQVLGSPQTEGIASKVILMLGTNGEVSGRVGNGTRTVLAAECALAGAHLDLRGTDLSLKLDPQISAMAATFVFHAAFPLIGSPLIGS